MEFFLLKLLPIFLVYFATFTKLIKSGETVQNVTENNYLIVENILDQDSKIKTGDLMNCEVIKTIAEETNKNDTHVFTKNSTFTSGYVFYPASKDKKCFSFQVRTKFIPCIHLSTTPVLNVTQLLDVALGINGTYIRKNNINVNTTSPNGIVNDKELRGFWIRWLDDHLLEVGRDTDNYPIVSYRLPEKLSVNFTAILSYKGPAEWILHEDPQCGAYNITKKIKVETKCKVGTTTKFISDKINFLQKLQQHILNQMKNKHEIFKGNKLRSKEILLVYQQLIEKLYRDSEENQNLIYAEDSEIYCPLKSITFNEISQEYLQFMAELQMELATFKQTLAEINSTNTNLELYCSTSPSPYIIGY